MLSHAVSRERTSLLSLIFLSEKGRFITPFVWTVVMAAFALSDRNQNLFWVLVFYVVIIVAYVVVYLLWWWLTTTSEQRKEEERARLRNERLRSGPAPYTWENWMFIPGLFLILGTISLFFLGQWPLGKGDVYITAKTSSGVRVVSNAEMMFRLPLIGGQVANWDIDQTVGATMSAETADHKTISATVQVEISIIEDEDVFRSLAINFEDQSNYNMALQKAAEAVFYDTIGKYPLEDLPSHLILEDLIGTEIGLDGLWSKWSGAVIIENIHRTAD